jgi:hypothetical protein
MSKLSFTDSKHFQDRFNFIRDILLIIGVFFTGGSMLYAGIQTADNRKVASATFVNNIYQQVNADRYNNIILAIEGNDTVHESSYPILKPKGQFTSSAIDDYISNFDNVANLWQDGLVNERMAYSAFSYEAEKAWCNNDIHNYILDSRKADNIASGYRAFYYDFEVMTKRFLAIDGKTCADMDKE